jgi:hypothetical protein
MYIGESAGCHDVPEAICPIGTTFVWLAPTRTPIESPDMTINSFTSDSLIIFIAPGSFDFDAPASGIAIPPGIPGICIGVVAGVAVGVGVGIAVGVGDAAGCAAGCCVCVGAVFFASACGFGVAVGIGIGMSCPVCCAFVETPMTKTNVDAATTSNGARVLTL